MIRIILKICLKKFQGKKLIIINLSLEISNNKIVIKKFI